MAQSVATSRRVAYRDASRRTMFRLVFASPHRVLDPSGRAAVATLDASGALAETNPAVGDRFKFTAREFDAAIEQYYYRARYYDARTGRFTSEDPLGLAAGDVNLFRYVLNRPTVVTDPSGELLFYGLGWIPGYRPGEGGHTLCQH